MTMTNLKQKLHRSFRIEESKIIDTFLSWSIQAGTFTILSSIIYDRVRMHLENEMDGNDEEG